MVLIPPLLLALALPGTFALQIPLFARPPPPPLAPTSPPSSPNPAPPPLHALTLRHAVHLPSSQRHLPPSRRDYSAADLAPLAVADPAAGVYPATQRLRTRRVRAQRPSSQAAFHAARRASFNTPLRAMQQGRLPTRQELEDAVLGRTLEWDDVEIDAPDTNDVETLAAMGKMCSNAYTLPDREGWYDIGGGWNVSDSFGWKEDGLRGHVFADEQNKTVVLALKGTSAFLVGGGGGTAKNDKTNDNLLFSCCCARVDWSWSTVCDCYDGGYRCRQDCLEEAVITKSAYYPVATDLYNNVSAMYPHAQIWLAGHSLGGALAAMLSRTYGVPSVSFESPGDLLPARRLHLPLPPVNNPNSSTSSTAPRRSLDDELTTHVYHTADPIPLGTCTGTISTCGIAGFALESRCHTGKTIRYDTVGRLGWSVDVRTHPIHIVVEQLLKDDWGVPPKEVARAAGARGSSWFGWWPGRGRTGDGEGDEDGGGEEEDDGQNGGRGVPRPAFEDEFCSDCERWSYV
ncbi:Putative lipase atg15 [Rhodotorula kratochvilovae]